MQNHNTSSSTWKSSSSTHESEAHNWTAANRSGDVLQSYLPVLSERLRIIYASTLPAREKPLAGYLAWRVNARTGHTWVGITRMVRETGISRSTLKRSLKRLQELGWIYRQRRMNKSSVTILLLAKFGELERTES